MKHAMKSLKHNGIYVPSYDHKGFNIKIEGQKIRLKPKSEQMAIAWIRKKQSALSPPDKVFMMNFMREFMNEGFLFLLLRHCVIGLRDNLNCVGRWKVQNSLPDSA